MRPEQGIIFFIMEQNIVGWFEIPVTDMARARSFYESVLETQIKVMEMGDLTMGWFPMIPNSPGAPGALVKHAEFYFPSDSAGVLVYLSCPDVQVCLDRVEMAGGKVLQAKKQISEEYGYMGLLIDSEGNRIALHSRQ